MRTRTAIPSQSRILPKITASSSAFEDGWNTLASREPIGWPTKDAPREDTIVQFMQIAHRVLNSLDWPTYETHWVAGLFAAWLRRESE